MDFCTLDPPIFTSVQCHYKGYLKAEYETADKVENVVYFLAGVGHYESDEVAGPQER